MQAAICVGVADVRREPDASSELVTQALLGTLAQPGPAPAPGPVCDGWQHVQLVNYEGWVRAEYLASAPSSAGARAIGENAETGFPQAGQAEGPQAPAAVGATADEVIVVIALATPLFHAEGGDAQRDTLFCSTVLPLAQPSTSAGRLAVALPGGKVGWVSASDVAVRPAARPFPQRDADFVIETARRFLGTPYLWGGTTCLGLDCSGFAQLCFRMAGYPLPRDSYQQFAALATQPEGEPLPGDLLFFAKEGRVVHVAISLGDGDLIHAEGVTWNEVIHQSMNPLHAERYNHRLVELYCGARRVIGAGVSAEV